MNQFPRNRGKKREKEIALFSDMNDCFFLFENQFDRQNESFSRFLICFNDEILEEILILTSVDRKMMSASSERRPEVSEMIGKE